VRLEVIPKASYFKRNRELSFYTSFFDAVTTWPDPKSILEDAITTACKPGLSALDSPHIAAALSVGATEFLTSELSTKPLRRVREIKVTV
jgi:predicted nucleic acid-binding protein